MMKANTRFKLRLVSRAKQIRGRASHKALLFGLLASLAACNGSDTEILEPGATVDTDTSDSGSRSLQPVGDREGFSTSIKQALVNYYASGGGNAQIDFVDSPEIGGVSTPVSADSASTAESSTSSTGNFTTTNLQEQGVDEADRVKTDGSYLYVLSSSSNGVVNPAASDAISIEPGNTSSATKIRILQMDASAADSTLQSELDISMGNEVADGLYLGQSGSDANLFLTSSSYGGSYWGFWGYSEQWGTSASTIRKISVADRQNPVVSDSLTLQGQIISSRVIGNIMYVASRYFPRVEGVDPYNEAIPVQDALNNVEVEELLPSMTRSSDQQVTQLADAQNCFVAELPENTWYTPDIVTLAAINLDDLTLSDSLCYLGSIETLYASTNGVYLATTSYDFGIAETTSSESSISIDTPDEGADERPDVVPGVMPDIVVVEPRVHQTQTEIHQFNFVEGKLDYKGTGKVDGHLGWNYNQRPFRMSEKNGFLRVATQNDSSFFNAASGDSRPQASPVFLTILTLASDNKLRTVSILPNAERPDHLGKPGEQLHASRFLGDRGYLVTFRQTDPLYVLDLQDPTNPSIAGALEIDGYSDYLHPLGDNHLLGIGKGAIADTNGDVWGDGGRGAFYQGIKLSLFDISDMTNPQEIQSMEIGKRGTNSNALFDHHGITYRPASGDEPGRLALSIDLHDIPASASLGPSSFYNWRESGLYTFEISTAGQPRIEPTGKLIVEAATPAQPWGPVNGGQDRSVLLDEAVFYLHGDQVYSAHWADQSVLAGPR